MTYLYDAHYLKSVVLATLNISRDMYVVLQKIIRLDKEGKKES